MDYDLNVMHTATNDKGLSALVHIESSITTDHVAQHVYQAEASWLSYISLLPWSVPGILRARSYVQHLILAFMICEWCGLWRAAKCKISKSPPKFG